MATPRMRRSIVGMTLAAAGLTLLTGDTTGADQRPSPNAAGTGVALLRNELDGLAAAGVPQDHAKARMLRDDLAALEKGRTATAATEVGVDVAGMIAAAEKNALNLALMDNGAVVCEPIPGNLLTAAEIAGATCTSTLQPDGSSLYVAQRPDGTRVTVHFGADGHIARLPQGSR
jgi:hypothetical protein